GSARSTFATLLPQSKSAASVSTIIRLGATVQTPCGGTKRNRKPGRSKFVSMLTSVPGSMIECLASHSGCRMYMLNVPSTTQLALRNRNDTTELPGCLRSTKTKCPQLLPPGGGETIPLGYDRLNRNLVYRNF